MNDRAERGVALRVRGLCVNAGKRRILGPLDLELAPGESVLLVGPSGSGKSTLLRALSGLVEPSAGTIEMNGQPASVPDHVLLPPNERNVGMLFQGGALWPHMGVRRTLAFVLEQAGIRGRRKRERIAELLRDVQLEGFARRKPATLSGGEKQRLALARAMANRPGLLLLDEPLGPLDAELRRDLLERLSELQAEGGWTQIHVTHDPGEARAYAGRVLSLREGQLQASSLEAPRPTALPEPSEPVGPAEPIKQGQSNDPLANSPAFEESDAAIWLEDDDKPEEQP